MDYIIEKLTWVDEFGIEKDSRYQIKFKSNIIFNWWIWKYIKHRVCYEIGCYYRRTDFKTSELAELFIKNVLCKNKGYNTWEKEVISKIKCTNQPQP